MLLPLARVHGNVREHINGRFKHINASIGFGMMKTVARVAGFDIQAKGFAEAVRAAQMGVAWAAAFIRAEEHSVVMCCILIEYACSSLMPLSYTTPYCVTYPGCPEISAKAVSFPSRFSSSSESQAPWTVR